MRNKFTAKLAMLAIAALGAGAVLAQAPPAGGPPPGGPPRGGGFGLVPMLVESTAFPDGGIVPLEHSMYGANVMPDFKISAIPATAQSIAIIFHDLDVASGNNPDDNLHWMAWNIPVSGTTTTIERGKLPDGAVGRGMRGPAYAGPGAPNSPRYHHYVFEFYALNAKLDLPPTAGRPEVLEAMKGKVVAKHSYVGRFRNDTNAAMGGGAGGPPRGPGAPGAGPGAGGPPRGPGAGPGAAPPAPGGY